MRGLATSGSDNFGHGAALHLAAGKLGIDRRQPLIERFHIGLSGRVRRVARRKGRAVERQHNTGKPLSEGYVDATKSFLGGNPFGCQRNPLQQAETRHRPHRPWDPRAQPLQAGSQIAQQAPMDTCHRQFEQSAFVIDPVRREGMARVVRPAFCTCNREQRTHRSVDADPGGR